MRSELELHGTAHPDDATWILHFGYPTNPVPMNGPKGTHWATAARKAKQIRLRAAYLARSAGIPLLGRCRAQVTWWVAINRTRDTDNLARLEKPMYDGLVDACVVPDDRPAFMEKPRPVIQHLSEAGGLVTVPCFTLTVTRVDLEDEWGGSEDA